MNLELGENMAEKLLTIKKASEWASDHLNKKISPSNISYLIQYGKIKKYNNNGSTQVSLLDLKKYYESYHGKREIKWKDRLGDDLNWALSFDHLREIDTTKHVHRLHPYKGKFIPQLVEYFIGKHTDTFKKEIFFKKGDIILDPFSGSGTTLVQANELSIHGIGIDISKFNCLIAESKLANYDLVSLELELRNIKRKINGFEEENNIRDFEEQLLEELRIFNNEHFPSPEFRYKVSHGEIDEDSYVFDKVNQFMPIFNRLVSHYGIKRKQKYGKTFLDKWYTDNARNEINFALSLIKGIEDKRNKKVISVILSRTIRSCRATTHSDLGTLKDPQFETYYCYKHKKICKPLFSIKKMFTRYSTDTIQRLATFKNLKTDAHSALIAGDSRNVNIFKEVEKANREFSKKLKSKKIKGIFTSPPYVGQIDYHEQHAYAYELFGYNRKDNLEIGPLFNGQGLKARESYVEGIAEVLSNCKKYMIKKPNIFIVANDKYNLYPKIAMKAGFKIVNEYKRPVLNRTERDKSPYSEKIFHLINS